MTETRTPIEEIQWQSENWNSPDDPVVVIQLHREEFDKLLSERESLLAACRNLIQFAAIYQIDHPDRAEAAQAYINAALSAVAEAVA